MLRQDKKFTIQELTKLAKEIIKIKTRLTEIDKQYFIQDYSRIIDSLDMVDELQTQIGFLTIEMEKLIEA